MYPKHASALPAASKARSIIVAACLFCGLIFINLPETVLALDAPTGDEYAYRIAVERHLESRINAALREITGKDGIIAFVSADTSSESKPFPSGSSPKPLILPGVPAKEDIKFPVMPAGSSVIIKRLSVTVLVDTDTPKALTDTVNEVVVSLMGFNPERGDSVEIKRVNFKKQAFEWKSVLYPPMVFIAALAVFGTLFLIAATAFFLTPLKSFSVSLRDARGAASQAGEPMQLQTAPAFGQAAPEPLAAIEKTLADSGREGGKFSFLSDGNIAEAAYLMREAPDEDIAVIANYLDPELSARFLSGFPVERQAEAASLLSSSREFRHEAVDGIENGLKDRLEYVIGGEDRLASLLSIADDEMRERTMEAIERKDYNTALRLREKVKSFESVVRTLDARSLEALVRRFDIPALARILNSSSGDVQARLLESVSSGVSERIKEEMKYAGTLPPERLKHEKLRFLALYRKMSDAGELNQRSGGF